MGVPGYPTFVSSDGIVHVWPGNREICKTKPIPSNVIADFSLKSTETLSWPKLTEIREWDGVPWYSAVEITQDFTHLQFVHRHSDWTSTAACGWIENLRDRFGS